MLKTECQKKNLSKYWYFLTLKYLKWAELLMLDCIIECIKSDIWMTNSVTFLFQPFLPPSQSRAEYDSEESLESDDDDDDNDNDVLTSDSHLQEHSNSNSYRYGIFNFKCLLKNLPCLNIQNIFENNTCKINSLLDCGTFLQLKLLNSFP